MYRKKGSDGNLGTATEPLLTISKTEIADEGDTVIVREREYHESVIPRRGARTNALRITYRAAENERVAIKDSECVTD